MFTHLMGTFIRIYFYNMPNKSFDSDPFLML